MSSPETSVPSVPHQSYPSHRTYQTYLCPLLLGALLVAAIILAYQPAWTAGFIWDDDDYVTHNPLLSAPDGLHRIWFSTDSPSQYFPLTYTTFRLQYSLWGLNPAGYHWFNILLHAANSLLLWRLLHQLFRSLPSSAAPSFHSSPFTLHSFFPAALFALHPIQVESVAWITQLKNTQSLFFFLLSLLSWLSFLSADTPSPLTSATRRRWPAYALSLLFCAFALFSKTTACTLPAALVLILWLRHEPVTRARILQIVPFVLFGVAMGLVSIWWERHHQGTHGDTYAMPWLDRLLVATRASWFYLGKLLWPSNLTFNYTLWKIDATSFLAWLPLLAGLALAFAIYRLRRLTGRAVETVALFFIAMLSPLLGFIMLYTFKYTFVADHYAYVAVIGPLTLLAIALTWMLRAKPVWLRVLLPAALVLTLATLTWRQSRMYENLETLWTATIARNPTSYMGHNNLGTIYLAQGKTDSAIARFQSALEILPDHPNAHGNLAHALLHKGRLDDALLHFRRAAELEPDVAKAQSDLAFGLLQKGLFDESILHARYAITLDPRFAEPHNHLGLALLQQGDLAAAAAQFTALLALQPDSADAHYRLAICLFQQGDVSAAIPHFERTSTLQPQNPEVLNNLGWALLQLGRTGDAIARFRAALAIDPAFAPAQRNLALALESTSPASNPAASATSRTPQPPPLLRR
jgi:tetratricopeptide (TPR) repeat protein